MNEQQDLVDGFKKAFPSDDAAVSVKNFGIAIGAFERTLVTRSKWDDYIEKDRKALSNHELLGLKTFVEVGCTTCHLSKLLGGSAFQKLGLRVPYNGKDTGRMKITGSVSDKYMFKVPSLLNVEKTAPYYHDGSIATLEEAVKAMGKNQLELDLTDEKVANIVTFLKALTGKLPEEFAKKK
ncbi:MAG: cytochrome c peroxidase [Planctomycetota bacterium]